MPIIWRYLLRNYLQVFSLCVLSFIAVLFVMRFKDIAEFAAMSSSPASILLFSLYQIPYILPDAIPISCVIASMILFQKMSQNHELIALRAAGFSLKSILFPLLGAGLVISLCNFSVISEIAPKTKFLSKQLSHDMTASNPFFIFNKIAEGKMTNAYVDLKALRGGQKAKDVVLILNNQTHGRLGVMTAKELSLEGDNLVGKDVSIVSSIDSKFAENFDHLVIENQVAMTTKASNLSELIKDADWHMGLEYLPLRMVMAKAALKNQTVFKDSAGMELARRLSIAIAPVVFTLMGAAFGMEIGRNKNKKGIIYATLLSALYLSCFVAAKSFKHAPIVAWSVYFLPFPIIIALSIQALRNVSRGITS